MTVTNRVHSTIAIAAVILLTLTLATSMDAQTSEKKVNGASAAATYKILQIDMAVVHMDKMVEFYQTVFNTKFESRDVQGFKIYRGSFLGFKFIFAPNEIAGVNAEQSRHQFEIEVSDIDALAKTVETSGGKVRDGVQSDGTMKTLVAEDPDGNTIIFSQTI